MSVKKLIKILLGITFLICNSVTCFANEDYTESVLKKETKPETITYAIQIFPKLLHSFRESEELDVDNNEYYLGNGFTVFNIKDETDIQCFPVISESEIKAILEVHEINEEYSASLSVSFAKELNEIEKSNIIGDFLFITDGNHID